LPPPRCTHCKGYVRPGVVWFGEDLPQQAWRRAERCASNCDLMIAIGTSGLVFPAASLPSIASQLSAKVVEINPIRTPLSDTADLCLRSTASEALCVLASAMKA